MLFVSSGPLAAANGLNDPETKDSTLITISEDEIQLLLETYKVEASDISTYKTVKVFDENDALVYSEDVDNARFDSDLRLKALLNQSDYLTEVNDVKYYKLK